MSDNLNANQATHEPERMPPTQSRANGAGEPNKEDVFKPDPRARPKSGDVFADLKSLRITSDTVAYGGTEHVVLDIPVGKRGKTVPVRACPNPDYCLDGVALFTNSDADGDIYFVTPWVVRHVPEMAGLVRRFTLYLGITVDGDLFVWPVADPDSSGGGGDKYNATQRAAIMASMERWIRMVSNRSMKRYEIKRPLTAYPDPEWPTMSFNEILAKAFAGDKVIQDLEHPIIQRIL